MNVDLPALLGGTPTFASPLHPVRPLLPPLESVQDRLDKAMAKGQLTNDGEYVQEFERQVASYLGVEHAVAVSNATLGLMVLLRASVNKGSEVVMPSFTFSATAHAAVWAGLCPVFADILPNTYGLAPESVAACISDQTAAVLGVHMYGHPCEIDELQALADGRGIPLLFDAAHGFGSRYKGERLGRFGAAEVFSFHATKIFPVGEGGMITTRDAALAERLRLLRVFGDAGGGDTLTPGLNAKMQEFNALIGLENLQVIDEHVAHRRAIAAVIRGELASLPGLSFQEENVDGYSNYQNLSILVDKDEYGLSRDQLFEALKAEGILARKYFFPPLHRHEAYSEMNLRAPLPVTEAVSATVLCLPIYSDMKEATARALCGAIRRIHDAALEIEGFLA